MAVSYFSGGQESHDPDIVRIVGVPSRHFHFRFTCTVLHFSLLRLHHLTEFRSIVICLPRSLSLAVEIVVLQQVRQ